MSQQLYRFFDRKGGLLYVGVTLDPPARFRSHAYQKEWWDRVANISLESYPDRDSVLQAEQAAIHRERPRYNAAHNEDELTADRLTWTCDVCKEPIGVDEGYIYASWADIDACEKQEDAFQEKRIRLPSGLTTFDWNDLPRPAAWHVCHADCDPSPESDGYWMDIGRWSTADQALKWAAHLVGKKWIDATDLESLLYKAASSLSANRQKRQ